MNKQDVNMFDPPFGQLKKGNIIGFNADEGTLTVQLLDASAMKGRNPIPIKIPAPHSLFYNNGLFIGSLPSKDTPIIVGEGRGGQYFFVSHYAEDLSKVPQLSLGELLIQSTNNSFISLDLNSNIVLGSDLNNIHINSGNANFQKTNYITLNFENENHITQSSRSISGLIKRDLKYNDQFDPETKFENDLYDSYYKIIGMDPTASPNDLTVGSTKNPPLIEQRQLIYEYQYQSNIDDDITESNKYLGSPPGSIFYSSPNRRKSRADTLSLSLVSPNYLMESVKGTVVDIFGNILNLNRVPLPIGKDAATTLRPNISINQQQSYLNIRALERKSIAYHFELNARKDPKPQLPGNPPLDINANNYNAKLQRSRFSFDIDKEGQFKINVPASSETGNVSLLCRYENYSTFGPEDNNNPNKLWYRKDIDNLDIFVDSFAAPNLTPSNANSGFDISFPHGSVSLKDGNSDAGPIDRISKFVDNDIYHIKHGTAHHDILRTCSMHQNNETLNSSSQTNPNPININYIKNLSDIVSTEIRISGNASPINGGANAGGRSGSINLDGSLEVNIGANTIDRQSLWLDTAGGLVANVGRDRNQRSAIMNFDGDVIIQIGGFGVSGDARFLPLGQDGKYIATLDLRVFAGGYSHMFRIDNLGVTVFTPGRLAIQADSGIQISSDSDIYIDSESLFLNQRMVLKEGPSI